MGADKNKLIWCMKQKKGIALIEIADTGEGAKVR